LQEVSTRLTVLLYLIPLRYSDTYQTTQISSVQLLLYKSYANACAVCQIICRKHLELLTEVSIVNASVLKVHCPLKSRGSCTLWNAEIWKGVFCRISPAKRYANYTLDIFRIPQNSYEVA